MILAFHITLIWYSKPSVYIFLDLGFHFHLEFHQYKFRRLQWLFCLYKLKFFFAWIKAFLLIFMYFHIQFYNKT